MYFLEHRRNVTKIIKDAAGLSNSSCVIPFNTSEWRQTAVCETQEPLQEWIDSLSSEEQKNYRIISNNPDE